MNTSSSVITTCSGSHSSTKLDKQKRNPSVLILSQGHSRNRRERMLKSLFRVSPVSFALYKLSNSHCQKATTIFVMRQDSNLSKPPLDDLSRAEICTACGARFGLFKSKHHCYNCGHVYCSSCSSGKQNITKFGYISVNVCRYCSPYLACNFI
jgi:hypothetical protein